MGLVLSTKAALAALAYAEKLHKTAVLQAVKAVDAEDEAAVAKVNAADMKAVDMDALANTLMRRSEELREEANDLSMQANREFEAEQRRLLGLRNQLINKLDDISTEIVKG